MVGRNKQATFSFIKDRVWQKINSWSSKCLPKAGREVMIKYVLQAIPSYVMSIFLLLSSLIDAIEKMLNSFWWGNGGSNNRGIHWLSWEKLTMHKKYGGVSFKDLTAFNLAMLGKQGWKFQTHPDSLEILRTPLFHQVEEDDMVTGTIFGDSKFRRNYEDTIHVLFDCPRARNVWHHSLLWSKVYLVMWNNNTVADIIFALLGELTQDQSQMFATLLWSIWKSRNLRIWQNTTETTQEIVERARFLLYNWQLANKEKQQGVAAGASVAQPISV
ncbi:transmembrane protein, putative [Medicago truncatula]|uniref:Transmembrane protein, putative n=1 Tax=Medicago truncatula TaxID=3880 RepID=A0A072TK52_MEDTR|nr:transmembrane protein, putative [Medicago truncatula]